MSDNSIVLTEYLNAVRKRMSEMVKELEILEGLVELVSDSMKSAIQNAQNDQAETTNDAGEELKDSAA